MQTEDGLVMRHAVPADYDSIIGAVDEWSGRRHIAARLPRLFFVHFRPTSFVAEDEGAVRAFLVGFVSQTDPSQAYIHVIAVDPGYRFRGLGRALYERFFQAVSRLGCSEVSCVTSPNNYGSILFHTHLGFRMIPGDAELNGVAFHTDYHGPGESRVLFRRRLNEQG